MTAEEWNRLYPPGTRVMYREEGYECETATGGWAWDLSTGEPVVFITALAGISVALDCLEPLLWPRKARMLAAILCVAACAGYVSGITKESP